jgi:fimbrial chaperone protein
MHTLTKLFVSFTAMFLGGSASAASLSVSPIRLDLRHPDNSSRIVLRNDGARPMTAQVRVFKWSIVDGDDYYEEAPDIVVTPPVVSLAAKSDFNVRILRTTGAPPAGEMAYRVVIDEVPEGPSAARASGVTIAMRYKVPLFVTGGSTTPPQITWRTRQVGGKTVLVGTNSGQTHARIANLTIGKTRVGNGLQGYILGNSSRNFPVPGGIRAVGPISVDTDQGTLHALVAQ